MTATALVLADTHIGPGSRRQLPARVYDLAAAADVIFHAGDVTDGALLDELGGFAPVHAVLGNNDRDLVGVVAERAEVTIEGVRIALVHDSGARTGRARRMRRWFPAADVVVFGHSHDPVVVREGGQLLCNPGSATWKRRAPAHTVAVLELAGGSVTEARLVVLD